MEAALAGDSLPDVPDDDEPAFAPAPDRPARASESFDFEADGDGPDDEFDDYGDAVTVDRAAEQAGQQSDQRATRRPEPRQRDPEY